MATKKQSTLEAMTKSPEVMVKSTKEQILAVYHDIVEHLQEKEIQNP